MTNNGKRVVVHYTGRLVNGTIFDSSYERGVPLEFICGKGEMIKGFDRAVSTMREGEKLHIEIPCDDAYGAYNPDLIERVPRSEVPHAEQLQPGQKLYMQDAYAQAFPVRVLDITEEEVIFDMNHERAGQTLIFDIELVSVHNNCGCCG